MREKLLNNVAMKVLSIILAIIIWLLVTNIDNPYTTKTFTDIPVSVINEDVLLKKNKAWDIIEGDKVSVTLKAKRSVIDKVNRSDIQAVADLSKLSITNAVPIHVNVLYYDDEIKEKNLGTVDTMKVKLENIKTGQFPVTIETTGDVADGYAIGTKIPTPNIVEVSGPESLVKKINQVKATVNVQGLTTTQTFSSELSYYNYDGDKLDASRLNANVKKVEISVQLLKTKKVELKVETQGKVAEGYQLKSVLLEPKTVMIAGTEEQLQDISQIVISNLSIEGLKEETEENIDITEYLPSGIKLAQESPDVRVKFQIIPMEVKKIKIPTNKIAVKNQDPSLQLEYEKEEVVLVVRGTKESLEDVDMKNLNPTIDVSDLKEGSYTVELELKKQDGLYYETIPSVKISLKHT